MVLKIKLCNFIPRKVEDIMSMGIYVHVPFCRSKCFYCGFYSVASLQLKKNYIQALCHEMELRGEYLPDRKASTLYFGGGTPSYLDEWELEEIVNNIHKHWTLEDGEECSIEVNPEDAVPGKLHALKRLGFNRLTIGIQSFNDDVLKRINRTHSAKQAIQAVENAVAAGFDNVGIDLIIGLPGSTSMDLEKEFNIISCLDIAHISVYILSIDSNSVFQKLSEKGKFRSQGDDELAEQYLLVSDFLKNIGYEHYEISNFAKNFKYSRHNTSYWQQKPYIGLGPSAHSFDLESRQWNTAHLKNYIESLNKGQLNLEKEILSPRDKYNEYIMTRLRTMWGAEQAVLEQEFGNYWWQNRQKTEAYLKEGYVVPTEDGFRLTEKGWLISDAIFSNLFV